MNLQENQVSIQLAARRTAAVAFAFCCIILALLGANAVHSRAYDPLNAPKLEALIVDLNRNPSDTALKAHVRLLDQQLRTEYQRGHAFALDGFYLLLGGIALFLLANEVSRAFDRGRPKPDRTAPRRAADSSR